MNSKEWHGLTAKDIVELTSQQIKVLHSQSRLRIPNATAYEDQDYNIKQSQLQRECAQAVIMKEATPDVNPKSLIKRRK